MPSLENAFNKHPWPHMAVARSNVIDNVRRGGGIGSVTGRPLGHCAQRAQWPRERVLRRVVIDRPCMSLLGGGVAWRCSRSGVVLQGKEVPSKCSLRIPSQSQVQVLNKASVFVPVEFGLHHCPEIYVN